MSDARICPWWLMRLGRTSALRSAIIWTLIAALNAYLTGAPRVWMLMLLATIVAAYFSVTGWASYVYYRRHPEAEHTQFDRGGTGEG